MIQSIFFAQKLDYRFELLESSFITLFQLFNSKFSPRPFHVAQDSSHVAEVSSFSSSAEIILDFSLADFEPHRKIIVFETPC